MKAAKIQRSARKAITPEELRKAMICEYHITLAAGHGSGKRRLYALLDVSEDGWSIVWRTEINGVVDEHASLSAAVRCYCREDL
jgi:hypothetical protein